MRYLITPLFLFTLLTLAEVVQAQDSSGCYNRRQPLSYFAYRKMMRSQFNYTILGTQAPATGFKIETTNPSVSLKGNISAKNSNRVLVNLELTGGAQNNMMQIFSGDQLNGYFKASIGINYMLERGNSSKYVIENDFLKLMLRRKTCEYTEEVARQLDTLFVLLAISDLSRKPDTNFNVLIDEVLSLSRKDQYTIDGFSDPAKYRRGIPQSDLRVYYTKLAERIMISYGADSTLSAQDRFAAFMRSLVSKKDSKLKSAKILSDITRLGAFTRDRLYKYHLMDDYQIETYKDVWISKAISWFNISVTGGNSVFKMYDLSTNSLVDTNSVLPSLTVTYNYFNRATKTNRYIYLRMGIGVRRLNSLADLQKFEYKKETVVSVNANEQLKKEKSGTAYQGELSHGFGFEMPFEAYWTPWTLDVIPGIYGKMQYNYGSAWINKNKVGLDLGLIWNVASSDKDSKNLLTVIPYISWTNLFREYKDVSKLEVRSSSEKFSVGVRLGVPVNLGR